MAEAKKTTRKRTSTAKRIAAAPAPPVSPPKPTYEEVYAARLAVEEAGRLVAQRQRELTRDETYHGDFTERDRRVAVTSALLSEAQSEYAQCMARFEALRREAR